jgi:hypothetical protein
MESYANSRRHYMIQHGKKLFEGSLPVFVAATISSFIDSLLDYSANQLVHTRIGLQIVYAVFSHMMVYVVALGIPEARNLFSFIFAVSSDNASFAWNSAVSLIILKAMYNKHLAYAFSAWVVSIIVITLLVQLSNSMQRKYLKCSDAVTHLLFQFDSESFALSLSYSLTVIIAFAIYSNESTDYLSYTDDVRPILDDDPKSNVDSDNIFLGYTFVISIVLMLSQWIIDRRRRFRNESFNRTPFSPDVLDDHRCFDSSSSLRLFETFISFSTGCAWHVWSVLTFQNYFSMYEYGHILGLFIYALIVSVACIGILAVISAKEEAKVRHVSNSRGGLDASSSDGCQMDSASFHSLSSLFLVPIEEEDVPALIQKNKRLVFNFARYLVVYYLYSIGHPILVCLLCFFSSLVH